MQKYEKHLQTLKGLLLAALIFVGANYAMAAWSEPAGNPTDPNVAAPINTSNVDQEKAGNLKIAQTLIAGGVGIDGLFQLVPGKGEGLVLTSDDQGFGTWRIPTGGGGGGGGTPAQMECVSGEFRDQEWTGADKNKEGINPSSSGVLYPFSEVFSARNGEKDGDFIPIITVQDGWILTGCGASTLGDPGDNDEKIGENFCKGDQKGANIVWARACRVSGGGGGGTASIDIYQCPKRPAGGAVCDNGTIVSGDWTSGGCDGQISSEDTCTIYFWRNSATRSCSNACTPLGKILVQ